MSSFNAIQAVCTRIWKAALIQFIMMLSKDWRIKWANWKLIAEKTSDLNEIIIIILNEMSDLLKLPFHLEAHPCVSTSRHYKDFVGWVGHFYLSPSLPDCFKCCEHNYVYTTMVMLVMATAMYTAFNNGSSFVWLKLSQNIHNTADFNVGFTLDTFSHN